MIWSNVIKFVKRSTDIDHAGAFYVPTWIDNSIDREK